MAAIDTLGYAKHLQGAGIEAKHAEAHAEAVRDYVMKDLVTKADMDAALDRQTIRLAVIVGAMLTAAVGALTLILRASGN